MARELHPDDMPDPRDLRPDRAPSADLQHLLDTRPNAQILVVRHFERGSVVRRVAAAVLKDAAGLMGDRANSSKLRSAAQEMEPHVGGRILPTEEGEELREWSVPLVGTANYDDFTYMGFTVYTPREILLDDRFNVRELRTYPADSES